MSAVAVEAAITRLIHEAPAIDGAVVAALRDALAEIGGPLAAAISDVVAGVAARQIDAGIALPALAMACATLVDPALGEREREAARYEIDTLRPLPDGRPSAPPPAPDVPLTALSRGPRPRT